MVELMCSLFVLLIEFKVIVCIDVIIFWLIFIKFISFLVLLSMYNINFIILKIIIIVVINIGIMNLDYE